jgi:hypothetical protein
VRPLLSAIFAAASVFPLIAHADDRQVESLQAQIRAREAEIATLQRRIADLRRQRAPVVDAPTVITAPLPPERPPERPPASPEVVQDVDDEEVLASALESALVRQGGRVLSQGTIEIEPELSYFYDEPTHAQRRDNYSAALSARIGLPWSMQAEVRIPYVINDRWPGVGTQSGIGDIRLGLTREMVSERNWIPAILASVQWRTTTGDINQNPPTGFGQDGLQFGLTAAKRLDPLVVFGGITYTTNLGTAPLRNGSRLDAGDGFGGRLGVFLSVTPDTSLLAAVSATSFSASRFDEIPSRSSDRLQGVLLLGGVTTLGRGLFLNVTAGIGITPSAPNLSLVVSLPYRF